MAINKNTNWQIVFILLISIILNSCEKTFEYSPYQVDVDSHKKGINTLQIKELQNNDDGSSEIIFAIIADVHYHYTSIGEIIDHINSDPEIEFILTVGDITDQGLQKEFDLYYNIMEGLNKPYITIIGNHDYRSNGEEVYKKMYGPTNFNFTYKNTHFVGFDDVFWENESSNPNFNWLDKITSNYETDKYQIIIAHLPPFYDQYTPETEDIYTNILSKNNVSLSLHGHSHGFYYGNYYKDSVTFLVTPWPKDPVYNKVRIKNNRIKVEKIEL